MPEKSGRSLNTEGTVHLETGNGVAADIFKIKNMQPISDDNIINYLFPGP
jgi:hypothetical protein